MRPLENIVVEDTQTSRRIRVSMDTLREWSRLRGLSEVPFHFYVTADGVVHEGMSVDEPCAHLKDSIGVCIEGGFVDDPSVPEGMTPEQDDALFDLVRRLKDEHPDIRDVRGLRDVKGSESKSPGFSVRHWFSLREINEATRLARERVKAEAEGPLTRSVIRQIVREEVAAALADFMKGKKT